MASGEPMRLVRVGRESDRSAAEIWRVAETLARAFHDDPLMRYAIPDAEERRRVLPWLIHLNVRYGCRYGEVYAAMPDFAGAAIWLPPQQTTLTLGRMLRAGMLAAPLRLRWPVLRRLAAVEGRAARLHERCAPMPRMPHWYLSQIGVAPAHQRQGVASRLLLPILARADGAMLPCYLETENAANIAVYERFGFRVIAEESGPGDGLESGPHIWGMLRGAESKRAN